MPNTWADNFKDVMAGRRIKLLRTAKGISQQELAAEAGCSRNTIDNIEHGSEPRVLLAIRIAAAFGKDVGDIWGNMPDTARIGVMTSEPVGVVGTKPRGSEPDEC